MQYDRKNISESPIMKAAVLCMLVMVVEASVDPKRKFNDCYERWKAGETEPGMYEIHPNITDKPYQVYCNHCLNATSTIIQQRFNGQENFKRPYIDYQRGFGSIKSDYWAGLNIISALTYTGNTILRVDMTDWAGNQRWAHYGYFAVTGAADYYRLYISHYNGGTAPDDLSYNNGMYFFTWDRPDQHGCAQAMGAGWWYYYCTYSNPNGQYYVGGHYNPNPAGFWDGIYWKDWTGYGYSLKSIKMTLFHV